MVFVFTCFTWINFRAQSRNNLANFNILKKAWILMVRQTLLCYQIIFHCSWAINPPRTCGGGWFYVLADLVLCGWVAVSATLKIIPVLKIFLVTFPVCLSHSELIIPVSVRCSDMCGYKYMTTWHMNVIILNIVLRDMTYSRLLLEQAGSRRLVFDDDTSCKFGAISCKLLTPACWNVSINHWSIFTRTWDKFLANFPLLFASTLKHEWFIISKSFLKLVS